MPKNGTDTARAFRLYVVSDAPSATHRARTLESRAVPLEAVLRALIVAVLLLPILGAAVDTLAPGLLPPELAAYSESRLGEPMTALEYAFLALAGPLFVSAVGLWLLKPWARWLYTAVTVVAFALAPFDPPWVGSGLASTFNDLATFCDGAVVALIWFSDLRGRFEAGP